MAAPCAAHLHVYVPWRKWCGRQCERMRWPCAGHRRRSQENTEEIMVALLKISVFLFAVWFKIGVEHLEKRCVA